MSLDLTTLRREHVANTPRQRDHKGRRVDEAPQCVKDLEAYPCTTKKLLDELADIQKALDDLLDEYSELKEVHYGSSDDLIDGRPEGS